MKSKNKKIRKIEVFFQLLSLSLLSGLFIFFSAGLIADKYEQMAPSTIAFELSHPELTGNARLSDNGLPTVSRPGIEKEIRQRSYGFMVVSGIVILFFTVSLAGFFYHHRGKLTIYREYEKYLLLKNKLSLKDVLDYHAQYHWSNYAAVSVGMVLVVIVILLTEMLKLSPIEQFVHFWAAGFISVAAILLCWADLLHTNTQSPIIPAKKRFALIDQSVKLGTLGTMLMLFAIMFLVTLINLTTTIISSLVFLAVFFKFLQVRRISLRSLADYFGLEISEEQIEDQLSCRQIKKDTKNLKNIKYTKYYYD